MNLNRKEIGEKMSSIDLELIPVSIDMAERLFSWMENDPNWELYNPLPIGKWTFPNYKQSLSRAIQRKPFPMYAAVANGNNSEPLGKISVNKINMRNRSIEIGFYVDQDFRGLGLGSFMLSEFLKIIPDYYGGLDKIYATCASVNQRSRNLVVKFDFSQEAVIKDYFWLKGKKSDMLIFSKKL